MKSKLKVRIENPKLDGLIKEYNKLGKDEKIISISEVKSKIDNIIDLTEELEEMLESQLSELYNSCDDDCGCNDEEEQSELYEFYSNLEDKVLGGNLYRALRIVS